MFCRFIRSACFVCPVQCVSAIYIICIVLPELCVYSCFSLSMPFLPEEKKKKKKKKKKRVVLRMGCSGNKTNHVTWYLFGFLSLSLARWCVAQSHSLSPIKYYPFPPHTHTPSHVTTGKTIPVPRFHSLLLIFSFSSSSHCLAPTVCTRFFAWDCPRLAPVARDFLPCDY